MSDSVRISLLERPHPNIGHNTSGFPEPLYRTHVHLSAKENGVMLNSYKVGNAVTYRTRLHAGLPTPTSFTVQPSFDNSCDTYSYFIGSDGQPITNIFC